MQLLNEHFIYEKKGLPKMLPPNGINEVGDTF